MAEQKIEVPPSECFHITDNEVTSTHQHAPSARARAETAANQSGLLKHDVRTTVTVTGANRSQRGDARGGFGARDAARCTWESKMRRHAAAINMAAVIARG